MPLSEILIVVWIHFYSIQYEVDPHFAHAVAIVECGPKGIRSGPLNRKGTYIGPFAIHKDFRNKWDIDDPRENIRIGVAALRGCNKVQVLRRYNTKCNSRYIKAVRWNYHKLGGRRW